MGGHGGLNILPQKRWNVYNYENREKVRRDEEAAAKEEQLKREQSRKRDAEFRLGKLRQARGLSTASTSAPSQGQGEVGEAASSSAELKSENDSKHINLFEGIRIFDPIFEVRDEKKEKEKEKNKKLKKEEAPRVVTAEDEKYRLGYGVAGKGVKLPWYMAKLHSDEKEKDDSDDDDSVGKLEFGRRNHSGGGHGGGGNEAKKKKKTLQELREERLKRERKENEREKSLIVDKSSRRDRGFSTRR